MPYRRLPNTDTARVKALKLALSTANNEAIMPFSKTLYDKAKDFLPKFQQTLENQKKSKKKQISNNKKYKQDLNKIKTYISHFLQVVNMSIVREELTPEVRKFYGISPNNSNIPKFNKENDIIFWGKKIIEGEELRVSKGGEPIKNPDISLVKFYYENFIHAFNHQKNLKELNLKATNEVSEIRPQADKLILELWNEIERCYKKLPVSLRRERSQKFGVVYVYRKNEPKPDIYV